MNDPSSAYPDQKTPPVNSAAVTPNDAADLAAVARRIYVGGAGDLAVALVNDASPVVLKAVPVGTVLELRVRRVYATNTTATNLVALW